MRVEDLDTPAVTIDLDRLEANIARTQARLDAVGRANRPHIKTHKIPAIGRMQMKAGAIGLTCQKLGEVEVFIDAGVADDILLTFNIVGRHKTERLMDLAGRIGRLAVVADNETVVDGLAEAARRAGRDLPVLVECDCGFGRNGVQSPDEALALARRIAAASHLRFEGLATYPNTAPRVEDFFTRAVALFADAGIPLPILSGGGTPALTSLEVAPMMTEHRAGTYVYNDRMTMEVGGATVDDCAMQVLTTVVSRPTEDRAIVDAGSKILTREQYFLKNFGLVLDYPEAPIVNLSEEHGMVDLSASRRKPKVGEVVSVVPNHCCVVSNMVDEVFAVRSGEVVETWPVAARGAVR
jgi:D-serine deaminase-like pyridoxal phosphate-dependent protein